MSDFGPVAGVLAALAAAGMLVFGVARCQTTDPHRHLVDGEWCWHEHSFPWWAHPELAAGHMAVHYNPPPCVPRAEP